MSNYLSHAKGGKQSSLCAFRAPSAGTWWPGVSNAHELLPFLSVLLTACCLNSTFILSLRCFPASYWGRAMMLVEEEGG